jgi:protein-disulfide isomerase
MFHSNSTQPGARSANTAAVTALLALAASLCVCMPVAAKPPAAPAPIADSTAQAILATVGSERITEAQVIAQDQDAFDHLREDSELKLHQLQASLAEAHYRLVEKQLNHMLDQRALELEAKARATGTDKVLEDIRVPAVTEDEVRAYFEANKSRAGNRTFEQLQPEITQYLANKHNTEATRHFFDGLRDKHGVASLLPPFRVAVDATGPAKGSEHAPVTIVEFGDFQCPFCRQSETTLQTVLQNHPDQVRLVFRELPLTGIHPNALVAAHAAVCADRQGMFWPMHDAMYQDQNALGQVALVDTARRIGLDADRFSACLSDGDTLKAVERDAKAADELNINETPYFLINGRPMHGSIPEDQIEAVITDELRRVGSKQHG